jgi:hypothetical protein
LSPLAAPSVNRRERPMALPKNGPFA